jgi:hypothetical protein
MKLNAFKSYLKHSYKGILIYLAIIIPLCIYSGGNWVYLIFFPFSLIQGYYQHLNKQAEAARLKTRGLTEEDIDNIRFVKKWEHTRQKGIRNHCIVDGGFLFGFGLSIFTSVITIAYFGRDFRVVIAEPNDMFAFIGYNYMIGAGIAVIIFRIRWKYNEKRFIRLTDPLANNYFAKDYQDI